MTPAWRQTWARENPFSTSVYMVDGAQQTLVAEVDPNDAGLIAAAPDLVRLVLKEEWALDDNYDSTCASCTAFPHVRRHADGCPKDAALAKAGFPTQRSRDEAREVLRAEETLRRVGG